MVIAAAMLPGAMSAAFIFIIVVALLVLLGTLWVALHFGVGHQDDD
jgi:hypothetical protein